MKKNFPLVKNSGKILQKVKIFHKVIPNKKLKLLKQQFYENLLGEVHTCKILGRKNFCVCKGFPNKPCKFYPILCNFSILFLLVM